jgi:GAF domain-containing protein
MPEMLLKDSDLLALAAAARERNTPLALLRAADAVGRSAMGHRLCTAMLFDAKAMMVQRIYSSDEQAYPLAGRKPKRDTAWGRQVLLERRVFVGDEAAIRQHFDDHALIASLGLRSIVNVPILLGGACVGTLNFLWAEAGLRPEWPLFAEWLGLIAAPDWISVLRD